MTPLTPRQQQVAELVRDGWSNKQIALALGISSKRVEAIIARIAQLWQLDHQRNIRVQIASRAA